MMIAGNFRLAWPSGGDCLAPLAMIFWGFAAVRGLDGRRRDEDSLFEHVAAGGEASQKYFDFSPFGP